MLQFLRVRHVFLTSPSLRRLFRLLGETDTTRKTR